jgi:hypothetical protein
LANVGDKETFTIKVANLKPYSSYVVNIASYATINRAGIQQIANQVVITDDGGNGTAAYEYSVTEEIFSIAQATSNINQITVLSKATINDIGEQYTSNEVSKQVRRGSGAPPITTPPSPPPSGSFSSFLAYDQGTNTPLPITYQVTLTKLFNSNYYSMMALNYYPQPRDVRNLKSVVTGNAPGVYITQYLEILDDQGKIVLARDKIGRQVTSAAGTSTVRLFSVTVTPAMFGGLGNGMTYKARLKSVRESDNVVSYSDMWPCIYIVESNLDTGA